MSDGRVYGDPRKPVIVANEYRCPACHGALVAGYGLAGGGMGTYFMHADESDCDYFHKELDDDGE